MGARFLKLSQLHNFSKFKATHKISIDCGYTINPIGGKAKIHPNLTHLIANKKKR
jgi:hypothetical protein